MIFILTTLFFVNVQCYDNQKEKKIAQSKYDSDFEMFNYKSKKNQKYKNNKNKEFDLFDGNDVNKHRPNNNVNSKCTNKCHEHATCVMGKCKCLHGYFGDGENYCNLKTPKILEITKENDILIISIDDFIIDATEAFCKVDKKVEKAISIEDNFIRCFIPMVANDKSLVSVSFDGKKWSDKVKISDNQFNQNELNFDAHNDGYSLVVSVIVLAIILVGIIFLIRSFCAFYSKKQSTCTNSSFLHSELPVTLNRRLRMNEQEDAFDVCFDPIDDSP